MTAASKTLASAPAAWRRIDRVRAGVPAAVSRCTRAPVAPSRTAAQDDARLDHSAGAVFAHTEAQPDEVPDLAVSPDGRELFAPGWGMLRR